MSKTETTSNTGTWVCDYCDTDVALAQSDEYYLWTDTHGWICADCRQENWNTLQDSIYNQ